MKKRLVIIISICFIVLSVTTIVNNITLGYCSEPQGDSLLVASPSTVQQLVVEFIGPSVAPEYHREYRAEFSAQNIEFCIRDYKNILLQETIPCTAEDFLDLLQKITALGLICHEEVREYITGGSTYIIELYDEDGLTLSLYNYGRSCGTFSGDINGLQHIVESLIPSFDSLMLRCG